MEVEVGIAQSLEVEVGVVKKATDYNSVTLFY